MWIVSLLAVMATSESASEVDFNRFSSPRNYQNVIIGNSGLVRVKEIFDRLSVGWSGHINVHTYRTSQHIHMHAVWAVYYA